jgi:hypothetical protein
VTVGRGWHRGATGRKDSRSISDSGLIGKMSGIVRCDKSACGAGVKDGVAIGSDSRGGDYNRVAREK